jgi:hypothetical protein
MLRVGGGLAVASFLTPHLQGRSQGKSARSCILVHLLGGPPHQDMWDLKPLAPAEVRGPFKPIATTVPGLQICEHLPRLGTLAHRYALIRSVSHNNHNHTPMIYYSLTGRPVEQPLVDNDVRPPQRTDFPHVGAVLAHLKGSPAGLPGFVAIPEVATRSSTQGEFKRARQLLRGGGAGFLGPICDPLGVNGDPGSADGVPAIQPATEVSEARLESRVAILNALDQRGAEVPSQRTLRNQAVSLTGRSGGAAGLFRLDGEPSRLRDRYGNNRFGRALLLARRLTEAGVPMIAVHFNEMTVCDGWDTHAKNFQALQSELLPMLDQGLSALLEDLHQRGQLGDTVVACFGEFGRTPRINKDAGRDHWGSCQSVLLAGGGIPGGQVVGSSDRIAAYPTADPIDPVDVHATIYHRLGLAPDTTIYDNLRRPMPICVGRAIRQLV